jgi:membrane-bound serine protease (ClpP class)
MPSIRQLGLLDRAEAVRRKAASVRPGGSPRRLAACLGLAVAGLVMLASASGAQEPTARPAVLHTTVAGPITPVIDDHLADAIARAEGGGHAALVVELDTPGGLDTSMRAIIQDFLDADVPVVVYVSPQGARAGSAGALITLSAHVAAMAPGTAIGASTPVDLEGGEVSDKVVNDAAAYAEAVAELRGRNAEVAVDMVREGRSLPASEALALDVVDVEAASLPELLDLIDGMAVDVGPDERRVTLATAGAVVDDYEMGLFRRIQQTLADPNLAFLFLSIGTLGLVYELATPGVGVGGVVGLTCILLALFSLSVLPVSAVGILLLLLSAALFVAELFAPGVGIAAAGGTVMLLLSGVFLFRDAPGLQVSMAVVVPVAAVVGCAVVIAGRLVWRARRARSTLTGPGLFVGRVATVSRRGAATQAFVEGAWWNVRSSGDAVDDGTRVRIVDVDGLDLVVEPCPEQSPQTPTDTPRTDAP